MGKFKEIWNGEHRSFVRYSAFATLVFLLMIFFFGEDNLMRGFRAGREIRHQEKQIEQYNADIEAIDKQLNTLVNDKDSLEKFAREHFNFAAPGDDVFIIEE